MKKLDPKWTTRWLDTAQFFSTWSKDPSSQIGAVAVVKGSIPIPGYNGFPRGIDDTPERLNNREVKYGLVVHAEMNCIYNASKLGVSLEDADLYVYGLPVCSQCSLGIIQAGIRTVFIRPNPLKVTQTWIESFQKTADNFEEAGVAWFVEAPRLEGPIYLEGHRFT